MTSQPSPPDRLEPAWQRVLTLSDKLTEAVDALDDLGGLKRLAPRWSPRTLDRALTSLLAARRLLDAQIAILKARRSGKPS